MAAQPVAALVFVDESGANTKMTRRRGRALGGQRLLARVPHGHSQTGTLISGVRLAGPWFAVAINGEMFWSGSGKGWPPRCAPET